MRTLLVIIQLFSYSVIQLFAQQQTHEISVYGGGGLSTLRYQLSSGDVSTGFGGDLGLGYTCFFDGQLGIHTGVGLGLYTAQARLADIKTVTSNLTDSEGDRFDLHTTLTDYSERQNAMFLNIPVMLQFQTPMDRSQKQGFYAMGGIKTGIPLGAKYSSSDAALVNEAWYPEYDNWALKQEFAGYGVFDGGKFDGSIDLGVSVMLSLEAGVKLRIGNELALYVGAYFDYGLNNTARTSNMPFINHTADNPSGFTANSVLSTFSDKTGIMAAGVKLRVALGI